MGLNKVNNFLCEFRKLANEYNFQKNIYLYFVHWMYLRYKYWIDMEGYFKNEVWRIFKNHDAYFEHFHKYIHTWKYVYPRFNPGLHSQMYYKLDYIYSKLFCPGLDAMDYFRYEFYNYSLDKKRTFVTEGGIKKMDSKFNGGKTKSEYRRILMDKPLFNEKFKAFIKRDWFVSQNASIEDYKTFFAKHNCAIIKPIDGVGGANVYKVTIKNVSDIDKLYSETHSKKYLIEEVIVQHPALQSLNPSSVNTIRICSVESNGQIYITAALIRIGSGNGVTDNYSAGGLAATIDIKDGIIISPAVSQNNAEVYIHPTSMKQIIGTRIPQWEKVKDTVLSAHSIIPQLRYIGWDVVVCEDNTVTFIEANTCPGVELQQHPLRIGVKPIYAQYL